MSRSSRNSRRRPGFPDRAEDGARQPVLAPSDMQKPLTQIDLLASQADQFRNAQSMPVGDQNHRGVPVTMASEPPGRGDQPVDLGRGQARPGRPALAAWAAVNVRLSRKRSVARRSPTLSELGAT